ncbi:MAG: succinate dehydrogenase, hydrophobic membrane anchor protein [Aestuariivita sp.]|nr:succinate dehydrogenase, hydrophobic membrane anchor protein [Aestuariivita sp.]
MGFLTDRKRAVGLGSAKSGTDHFWRVKVQSFALLILIPLFLFSFGSALGGSYDEITIYFSQPFPALVAALTIVVGMLHFKDGAQVLIEDYVHGLAQKVLMLLMICFSYALAATGVFAIARLAL